MFLIAFFVFVLTEAGKYEDLTWSFAIRQSDAMKYPVYVPVYAASESIPAACAAGFTYDDTQKNGPSHWGSICTEWQACNGTGQRQSPIDIVTNETARSSTDAFEEHYLDEFNGTLLYRGYTYTMNVESEQNTISGGPLDGQEYELLQFHFHTPAEHTIDGYRYPLELHLVHVPLHKTSSSGRVVVAMFFNISDDSSEESVLSELIEGIMVMEAQNNSHPIDFSIHLHEKLFPAIQANSFYHYLGSLTTPPCTEDVTWFVMAKPLYLTQVQLNFFYNVMNTTNSRPIQSLESRVVTFYELTDTSKTLLFWSVWGGIVVVLVLIVLYYIFCLRRKNKEGYLLVPNTDPAADALLDISHPHNTYQSNGHNPESRKLNS